MNMIQSIYKDIYGDSEPSKEICTELSIRLSKAIDRDPWIPVYIRNMVIGTQEESRYIRKACFIVGCQLDKDPPLKALIEKIEAFSINGHVRDNSIILGKSEICPVCGVTFVGKSDRVYCSNRCKDDKRNERRRVSKAGRHDGSVLSTDGDLS